MEISARRASSGFGPTPLSWVDLASWQSVTRNLLTPLERDWIFALDQLCLEQRAQEIKDTMPAGKKK